MKRISEIRWIKLGYYKHVINSYNEGLQAGAYAYDLGEGEEGFRSTWDRKETRN